MFLLHGFFCTASIYCKCSAKTTSQITQGLRIFTLYNLVIIEKDKQTRRDYSGLEVLTCICTQYNLKIVRAKRRKEIPTTYKEVRTINGKNNKYITFRKTLLFVINVY